MSALHRPEHKNKKPLWKKPRGLLLSVKKKQIATAIPPFLQ